MTRSTGMCLTLLLLTAAGTRAADYRPGATDTSAALSQAEPGGCRFCFRGQPAPRCCQFLRWDTGFLIGGPLLGKPSEHEYYMFTGNLGVMFNSTRHFALGGTVHLAANDAGLRLGIGPTGRRWLTRSVAVEARPLLLIPILYSSSVEREKLGFAMATSLSAADWVSLDGYVQVLPYSQYYYDFDTRTDKRIHDTEIGVYVGISGRSYLAPIIPAVVGATFIILISVLPSD